MTATFSWSPWQDPIEFDFGFNQVSMQNWSGARYNRIYIEYNEEGDEGSLLVPWGGWWKSCILTHMEDIHSFHKFAGNPLQYIGQPASWWIDCPTSTPGYGGSTDTSDGVGINCYIDKSYPLTGFGHQPLYHWEGRVTQRTYYQHENRRIQNYISEKSVDKMLEIANSDPAWVVFAGADALDDPVPSDQILIEFENGPTTRWNNFGGINYYPFYYQGMYNYGSGNYLYPLIDIKKVHLSYNYTGNTSDWMSPDVNIEIADYEFHRDTVDSWGESLLPIGKWKRTGSDVIDSLQGVEGGENETTYDFKNITKAQADSYQRFEDYQQDKVMQAIYASPTNLTDYLRSGTGIYSSVQLSSYRQINFTDPIAHSKSPRWRYRRFKVKDKFPLRQKQRDDGINAGIRLPGSLSSSSTQNQRAPRIGSGSRYS